MSEGAGINQICIIVGASHAGVNCAFALRREGWKGDIHLYDADPHLPYHRPPLSKAYLTKEDGIEVYLLNSPESYEKADIRLFLGKTIIQIDRPNKQVVLKDESRKKYDKLVLAIGARPLIPPIPGIKNALNVCPLRTAADSLKIRHTYQEIEKKRVVIIGGGYIGLETAASLQKLGAEVVVLERESRVLARVSAPELSSFYEKLHTEKGVSIFTNKNVIAIETAGGQNQLLCDDETRFEAEMIVLGCGIRVNTALAEAAGLEVQNGIVVDGTTRTHDEHIYAIGDCTFHYNPHYDRFIRLESVQNAVAQAKVAAGAICGKDKLYDSIPWFWSDQYDVKLQMVGLSEGYEEVIARQEEGEGYSFSLWYFKGDSLIAVDAVNHPKAYVLGTKFIKNRQRLDKARLIDSSLPFKPNSFILNL